MVNADDRRDSYSINCYHLVCEQLHDLVTEPRIVDLVADPVTNVLRAGQVSLHTDLLLHGSAPNTSDRRRAGLTLRYAAADVRLIDGYDYWRKNSVVVRGADRDGFWFDRRRPDGEHPEKLAQLWGEFDGQPIDAG